MGTAPTSRTSIASGAKAIVADAHLYAVGRLRALCRRRGMPVAELARRSLMDEGQLGKVMRGERALRFDEAQRVCYALGLRVNEQLIKPEVLRELRRANGVVVPGDVVPEARRGGRPW